MKHLKTCENFDTKYKKIDIHKSKNPVKRIQYIQSKNRRTISFSNKHNNNNNNKEKNVILCPEHKINFVKYCRICKEDLCPKCYKDSHLIHDVIDYEEISLNENQIHSFKDKIEVYCKNISDLLKKIKDWRNNLEKNIRNFELFIQNKIINAMNKMKEEYNKDNMNYNKIIEYRMIYSLLLENNEDKLNNQKLIKLLKTFRSLKNYDEHKYININQNFSLISLDNIQLYNDLINKGNFENKGNNILKLLYNNYSLYNEQNEDDDNLIVKLSKIKSRNNINNKSKKLFFNKSSSNILKNSFNNFKNILYEKKKPLNLINNKKNNIQNNTSLDLDEEFKDNININSIINSKNKNIEQKPIYNYDYFDDEDDINIDLDFNYHTESNIKNKSRGIPIIFNNFNNINNINNKNNYINTYKIGKINSDRSHKSKVYTHRKFNSTLTKFHSDKNTLDKSQSDYDSEKNNEGVYNTLELNNIITETNEKYFNMFNTNDINFASLSQKLFPEDNNIKIIKEKEIEIDPEKDIYIGFELGNSQCRIGLINQNFNEIKLWIHYDDNNDINIPCLISFIDKYDNILIGKEAENERIKNPNYTINNFVKLIGKNWDEIDEKKEFLNFKLYNDDKTKKPYIKGWHKSFRSKIYNMEDLLSLFLRKIFENFLEKIKLTKKSNKIQINLIVSVPNNFNYLQRKAIEKIFLTQLFTNYNDKKNLFYYGKDGIENILIKNIKIESSSNLGFLYEFFQKNDKYKSKNVIIIYIEGSSVNISLVTYLINKEKNNKYEIKGIKWAFYGEENFTDNFESLYLNKYNINLKEKSPSFVAEIRTIFEKNKINFCNKKKHDININNEYQMTLDKNNYEKSCNDYFNKIVDLINELLEETSITKKQIDDIIFIGYTTNINIIKQKISLIFKNKNNLLYKKLIAENKDNFENILTNPDYIVIGSVIQSYNLFSKEEKFNYINNKYNKYKYSEITPISFGIEGLNKKMIFIIKKGDKIPIKSNKSIKLKINEKKNIDINIYEGEDKYVYNNRLISNVKIDINNLKNENNENIENDTIDILVQFNLNLNFDLKVFILDNKTLKKKFECVINIVIEYK